MLGEIWMTPENICVFWLDSAHGSRKLFMRLHTRVAHTVNELKWRDSYAWKF